MDDEISAGELQERFEDGSVRVVDIRSPAAFRRGHIPGSENIPMGELPDRIEDLDGAENVVTVCPHGEASVQAARLIASYEGFDGRVESLGCGVTGWDGELATDGGAEADAADEGPEAPF